MYRLVFLNGRLKGRRVAVQQGSLLVGRDPACQVDLQDDDEVSHRHALLEPRADGIWIKDLGSMNRTEVNGQAVLEALLKPGDRIEIGRTQFEFQLMETAAGGSRRRVSKVQILTFVAIGIIFLVQGLFMLLQFARNPAAGTPPPPIPKGELEPELQRAVALRKAAPEQPAEGGAQKDEVAELRAAVAELREQLDDIPEGAPADAAPVVAVEPPAAPPAVVPETAAPAAVDPSPASPAPVVVSAPEPEPAPEPEAPHPVREEPPPAARIEDPPERPTDEDPLAARAKQMLAAARAEIDRSNLVAADQALERIQIMAPDYIPAYVERAGLYERRAMLNKAGEQWALVMDLSKGTPQYAKAAAERQRLAQAEVAVSTTRKPLEERPQAARLPRRIRILSIDRERFPAGREFDEMRLVRVNLKPRLGEGAIAAEQVEVRAFFYDREIATGNVAPTRGAAPEGPLRTEGPWPAGEGRAVTATYILKKGFRQEEERETGQKRIYEGYRVQVFYRGELQDEDAQPRSLLKLGAPEPEVDTSSPVPLR